MYCREALRREVVGGAGGSLIELAALVDFGAVLRASKFVSVRGAALLVVVVPSCEETAETRDRLSFLYPTSAGEYCVDGTAVLTTLYCLVCPPERAPAWDMLSVGVTDGADLKATVDFLRASMSDLLSSTFDGAIDVLP